MTKENLFDTLEKLTIKHQEEALNPNISEEKRLEHKSKGAAYRTALELVYIWLFV